MNDLIKIIVYERNTLLKGWVISTVLILPFTFLPTLIKYGFSLEAITFRIPDAILYAFGFSLIVIIVAVIHNYNNLVDRKRIFDKPAFKALAFYGRLDGLGSIVRELETFLLGKTGSYYFRLNLIAPESGKYIVEIVPLIDTKDDAALIQELKNKFGFRQNRFLGKKIRLSEAQLNDEHSIRTILEDMESDLKRLHAKPLAINEFES